MAAPTGAESFLLYSTTPEGCQERIVTHVRSQFGGPDALRMVILQTPLEVPNPEEVEKLHAQFSGYGLSIDARDAGLQRPADASDPVVLDALGSAHVILATGGDPERMARIIRGTPADRVLRSAIARGVVVGGGSAGAMVTGAGYLGGPRDDPRPVPCLGWRPDVVVAPHFGMYPIEPWIAAWPTKRFICLRDEAVVFLSGNDLTSLGRVPAVIYDRAAPLSVHGDVVRHTIDVEQP